MPLFIQKGTSLLRHHAYRLNETHLRLSWRTGSSPTLHTVVNPEHSTDGRSLGATYMCRRVAEALFIRNFGLPLGNSWDWQAWLRFSELKELSFLGIVVYGRYGRCMMQPRVGVLSCAFRVFLSIHSQVWRRMIMCIHSHRTIKLLPRSISLPSYV